MTSRPANWPPSAAATEDDLAKHNTPLVARSRRCTGYSRWPNWSRSACKSGTSSLPQPRCTRRPAGLSMATRSSSSHRTVSGGSVATAGGAAAPRRLGGGTPRMAQVSSVRRRKTARSRASTSSPSTTPRARAMASKVDKPPSSGSRRSPHSVGGPSGSRTKVAAPMPGNRRAAPRAWPQLPSGTRNVTGRASPSASTSSSGRAASPGNRHRTRLPSSNSGARSTRRSFAPWTRHSLLGRHCRASGPVAVGFFTSAQCITSTTRVPRWIVGISAQMQRWRWSWQRGHRGTGWRERAGTRAAIPGS